PLFKAGEAIEEANVWFGTKNTVPLTVAEDVRVTLPKPWKDGTTLTVRYQAPLPAPIMKGDAVAELVLANRHMNEETRVQLVAMEDVGSLSGVRHMVEAAKYYVLGR